jgi:hypothetical protein
MLKKTIKHLKTCLCKQFNMFLLNQLVAQLAGHHIIYVSLIKRVIQVFFFPTYLGNGVRHGVIRKMLIMYLLFIILFQKVNLITL